MKLTELKTNQSAELTYEVKGCLSRGKLVALFSGDDKRHPLIADAATPELQERAEISLDYLENLDLLFEYWRRTQNQRSSRGTTDCDVMIIWRNDDGVIKTEEFVHAFPPESLEMEYIRFFNVTMHRTISNKARAVAEEKRNAFCDWARNGYPLKEIRFLDEQTVCVLLDPDRSVGLDARWLAQTLSEAFAEQTQVKTTTCQVFDDKKNMVSSTFNVPKPELTLRIGKLPLIAFWGLISGLILIICMMAWLLWWPIKYIRQLVRNSRHAA
jgi:hypothetical protein